MAPPAPLLLLALLAPAVAEGAAAPSPAEEAGRRLYEEGRRRDGGPAQALLGPERAPAPATAVPCASCHGRDGRGRPEGALAPPAVTWEALTRPRGHQHGLRAHGPFDERSLARAVQDGVDPSGHRLSPAMPAYSLSRAELEDLVAWLRRLDWHREPGVEPDALRLGVVVPAPGPGQEAGEVLRAVLAAAFAEVNAAGGVNGRRLVLEVAAAGPGGAAAAVRALAGEQGVFALVSGFLPGQEAALANAAAAAGLPVVGLPSAPAGQVEPPVVFSLLSGPAELSRVLLDFAAKELALQGRRAAVVRPEGVPEGLADAALAAAAAKGWRGWEAEATPADGPGADAVARLRAHGVEVVLHLGDRRALAGLLRQAEAAGWRPVILAPAAGLASAAGYGGRLFMAFPTAPADLSAAGRAWIAGLPGEAGAGRFRTLQTTGGAAVAVLREALRRAGRDVTREGLAAALEGLRGVETGLLPPLGYGPGRRVGALGGYVLEAGAGGGEPRPVGGWRGLE